jgi:hypothetical protein
VDKGLLELLPSLLQHSWVVSVPVSLCLCMQKKKEA